MSSALDDPESTSSSSEKDVRDVAPSPELLASRDSDGSLGDSRPGGHLAGRVRGASTVFSDLTSVSGARLGAAGISAVGVIMATRILTPSGYALVAYVTIVQSLMYVTTSAWTAAATTRYGREELERTGMMTATSWNRLTVTAPLVLLATLIVVALKLAHALPPEMTWIFVELSIISGFLLIASEHVVNLLETSGRMKLTAISLAVRQAAIAAVLALILISGRGQSPLAVSGLSAAALAGVLIPFSAAVWKTGLWPPSIDRALMRRILIFSFPMIAFSASQYVIRSVDLVVLRAFDGATDAGIYALAYQGYSVLQQITTTATIVLTPLFVSLGTANKHAVIERYIRRVVPQLTFLFAMITGLIVPLLGVVVPIVFGNPFRAAAQPLAVLFVALAFSANASFVAPILMLYERSRSVGLINLIAAVTNVVLDVVFVGALHMGILGPALATAVAVAVIAVGYHVTADRSIHNRGRGRILLTTPLLAAIIPVLLFDGGLAVGVGLLSAVVTSMMILRRASPFALADMDMVEQLDMPAAVKRMAIRGLRFAAQ